MANVLEMALYRATLINDINKVEDLLASGVDVNMNNFDREGNTPLIISSIKGKGYKDLCIFLIDKGATVNMGNRYGSTPLHHASLWGHLDIVELLLDKGAEVNGRNNAGETPLFSACLNCEYNIIDKLVSLGADWNIADNQGWTPLMVLAERCKGYGLVLPKIEGADEGLKNKNGNTAWDIFKVFWLEMYTRVETLKREDTAKISRGTPDFDI